MHGLFSGRARARRFVTAPAGGGALLYDTFTDVNGTTLTAHTMDVGPGWSVTVGSSWAIEGNALQKQTNLSTLESCWADAGHTDCTASALASDASGSCELGVIGRVQDQANFWLAYVINTTSFGLYEVSAGTYTQRTSGTFAALGTSYSVQLSASGTALSATVGGTTIAYTSASFQTATKWGLLMFNGPATGQTLDNFQVTSP